MLILILQKAETRHGREHGNNKVERERRLKGCGKLIGPGSRKPGSGASGGGAGKGGGDSSKAWLSFNLIFMHIGVKDLTRVHL